jgi:hypothetical protein
MRIAARSVGGHSEITWQRGMSEVIEFPGREPLSEIHSREPQVPGFAILIAESGGCLPARPKVIGGSSKPPSGLRPTGAWPACLGIMGAVPQAGNITRRA